MESLPPYGPPRAEHLVSGLVKAASGHRPHPRRHSTRQVGNENRSDFLIGGMARNEKRPVTRLRSSTGTGFTYVTTKNRRNDPDRLTLRKYDPIARQHVLFREER
jgi:ribosomal protein L33, bacterial type